MASRTCPGYVNPALDRLQRSIVAIVCIALAAAALISINGSAIEKDAAQNLQMGLDLCHAGVMSLDEAAPYGPSMYREPLPVATTAAAICIADRFLGPADSSLYFSGERAKLVKYQNVAWLVLLWIGVFAATRWFTGSFWLSIIAGLLAARPFLDSTAAEGVNDLYTELPGAALMALASLLVCWAVTRQKPWPMLVAGLVFGILTVTKAASLYIFAGIILVLAATYVRGAERPQRALRLALLGLQIAGFVVVVAPWIARNYEDFGKAQISDRGGLVLYTRALMDQVDPLEYRGTFYVWARPSLQRYVGSVLGFSARDLDPGGRLERLSGGPGTGVYEHDKEAEAAGRPQDAISFYRKARAERVRLEREFESRGDPHPDVAADSALQKEGMLIVKQVFWANLALVVPLIWRSALLLFPFLAVALLYALWGKRYQLALFILPSFATLCFYAIATHFEPRPASIAHPAAIVAACTLVHLAWRWYGARRTARASSAKYPAVRESEVPQEGRTD